MPQTAVVKAYHDPSNRLEVVWQLDGQDEWRSASGGPREAQLMPHDLVCGLEHGVRACAGFRNNSKARFGYRLFGEEQVHPLSDIEVFDIFRLYPGRWHERQCLAHLNAVLRAMGQRCRVVEFLEKT